MQYRKDKQSNELSVLGFGCMRFPRKDGKIDFRETEREILEAVDLGINYFDTAYIYGSSEEILGEIIEQNALRDRIRIATKLPQYLVTRNASLDKFFTEQKKRLRTDRVDYYLMHHLTDLAMWEKLKSVGAPEWLAEKKRTGEIGAVGFSYHGDTDGFLKILGDYDWNLCQIQYNYFDEHSQAGAEGLQEAGKSGIPVVIMEPLRGGKLVNMLPQSAVDAMENSGRGWTPAEWSFRWLYNQPEVTVVLSGMNSAEMLRENCRTASDAGIGQFTDGDFAVIREVTRRIREREKVGCTGCRYCMPCPKGVDIPGYFRCYNAMAIEDTATARKEFIQTVGLTKEPAFASQCIGCGKCEKHCPQNIPIREKLKEADRALRPFPYKAMISLGRKKLFQHVGTKKEK